jgi:hypothetical protein
MHFVKHPHLRPTEIPPPPIHKWQKLAERLKRSSSGLILLYAAGAAIATLVIFSLRIN